MQSTTFNSSGGRRSVGGKKSFFICQKESPCRSARKFSSTFGCSGHSAVEIIESARSPAEPSSFKQKDLGQPEEDTAPADEFEPDSSPAQADSRAEDSLVMEGEEEKKTLPENVNRIPDTCVKAAGSTIFSRRDNKGRVLMKSVTCCQIPQLSEEDKGEPEGTDTLKGSKSPDPFEDKHRQSETHLLGLINSTTNPESPLYSLQKSGTRATAELKAYKHFIISLFESACFIRKMEPIPDAKVEPQRLFIHRPKAVTCILFVPRNSHR